MKNITPVRTLIVFVVLFIAIAACKKEEIITVQEPTACFTVQITDPYGSYQFNGTATYIDSTFYFRNCSDSGANITYQWSFGDGATSTDKNPKHSYSKRGKYEVTLTVSNDNMAFDTLQQVVTVMLGQQYIAVSDTRTSTSPIAIEETANNEFVLLGTMGSAPSNSYCIWQLDSLLKQKTMKILPAGYRLSSMRPTMDGNYVFTGTTTGQNRSNELIKMSADGALIWNKPSPADDNYSYAAQTSDGGYAIVSAKPVPGPYGNTFYYTMIRKTDNNGNQQWQKLLDQEGMIQTRDAVLEQDGIVVAGVKRNLTNQCQDCDSVLIMKLNNSGDIVWKNSVVWGLNTSNWWTTRILKMTNGNYAVTNEYTRGIFYFSPAGAFLDHKLTLYQTSSLANSGDGKIIALQNEYSNGNRINVAKYTLTGVQEWSAYPDGRQKLPGGFSCCSDTWAIAIQSLRKGGIIATGYLVNSNNNYTYTIVLLEIDETGKYK